MSVCLAVHNSWTSGPVFPNLCCGTSRSSILIFWRRDTFQITIQGKKVPTRDLAQTWHRVSGLGQPSKFIFLIVYVRQFKTRKDKNLSTKPLQINKYCFLMIIDFILEHVTFLKQMQSLGTKNVCWNVEFLKQMQSLCAKQGLEHVAILRHLTDLNQW